MSELNTKFQQLTGINNFDIDAYIEAAEDKVKAYNKLQWKIAKGAIRKTENLRGANSEILKLYAEVMTGLADACGVAESDADIENIDINNNESTTDSEDVKAQETLSEAYAILDSIEENNEEQVGENNNTTTNTTTENESDNNTSESTTIEPTTPQPTTPEQITPVDNGNNPGEDGGSSN